MQNHKLPTLRVVEKKILQYIAKTLFLGHTRCSLDGSGTKLLVPSSKLPIHESFPESTRKIKLESIKRI